MAKDWRGDSHYIGDLVAKLIQPENLGTFSDVTFKLSDGSTLEAHRLILSLASPFFEAKFHGPWQDGTASDLVLVKDVPCDTFRRMVEFIYTSGGVSWHLEAGHLWELLDAAHMYLVFGLMEHCSGLLAASLGGLEDAQELVEHTVRAAHLYTGGSVHRAGLAAIKARLEDILSSEAWPSLLQEDVASLLQERDLLVTEGQLFTGVVRWCAANTATEEEAVNMFKLDFAEKFIVKNFSEKAFLDHIMPSHKFVGDELFRLWTFQVMENKTKDASRFALNPYKVHRLKIEKKDFLDPKNSAPTSDGTDFDIWSTSDEFPDVDVDIKVYQKISEGVHVPRGKFGIMVETIHVAKEGVDAAAITERVSIKMVAKKADGTVVKKLFKPIEDSRRDGVDGQRTHTFVLSKNREERVQWHEMEVVVIVDRRTKCNIKAISGQKFAQAVCTGPTMSYLNNATKFR